MMQDGGERGNGQSAAGLARTLDRERDILQAIMENSRAQLAYLDPQFRFVRVNSAYAQASGHTREELLGQNHFDLFPNAENEAIFARVRDTGQPVEYRAKPFEFADQPERGMTYWDWTLAPVKDADGRVQGLVLSLDDITEHVRAESQREAALQELREVLEQAQQRQAEVIALLDGAREVLKQHRFEDTARAIFDTCKHLTGATAGYVALSSASGAENDVLFLDPGGSSCSVDPSLPMPIRGLRAQVYQTVTTAYDNDFRANPWSAFLPEGHFAVENVLFAPLAISGEVVGLLGLAGKPGGFTEEDARVTTAFAELVAIALHNSRLRESLEASERRFRSVVETANAAIVAADDEGRVTFWNRMAETMFGRTAPEMMGQPLTDIIPDRLRAIHMAGMEGVLATGETRLSGETIETVGIRKDRGEFPLELSLATWQTAEGRFVTAVMRDITERKRGEEALREANESLGALIVGSPLAITAIDLDANVKLWNPAAERIFGWTEEEVLGRPYPLVPEDKQADFREIIAQAQAGQAIEGRETVRLRKEGRPIDVSAWNAPLYDAEGKVRNVMVVLADISERKRAEQALHQYAHEQNALYTVASAVTGTLDQAELLPLVLDAVLPALEADVGWVLLPGQAAADPPHVAAQRGADESLLEAEPLLPLETCPMYPRYAPDGGAPSEPCVVVNCPAAKGSPGARGGLHTLVCLPLCVRQSVLGVIKIGWRQPYEHLDQDRDLLLSIGRQVGVALNNAQLYEEARQVNRLRVLSELDRALAATLELKTVAEVTLKHMARHLDAPAASLLLLPTAQGHSAMHLLTPGRGWEELAPGGPEAGWWQSLVDRAREQGTPSPFAAAEVQRAGLGLPPAREWRANELAVPIWREKALLALLVLSGRRADRPWSDEDQALAQVASDHAGEAMRNAQLFQQVTGLLHEQEKTRVQLVQVEKMGALGRLAASIAHEINNPLQAVDSCLTLLKEELAGEQRADKLGRYLEIAAGEVGRISGIVRRMRDYYRPAHERLQATDLPSVLDSVLALSGKELQHRGITVERTGDQALPAVQANPDHLKQVFLNLILNAMDAMPGGGTLRIGTCLDEMQPAGGEAPQPAARVDIADTGHGMPRDVQARLFEPFFTTKEQGTGLGLSISYQIVEAHGGQITASSEVGVGTTFSILIPIG